MVVYNIYIHMYICICIYVRIDIHIYICIYIYIYICVCVCACVCGNVDGSAKRAWPLYSWRVVNLIYMYIHIRVRVCVCVVGGYHTHTHTHSHTHTQSCMYTHIHRREPPKAGSFLVPNCRRTPGKWLFSTSRVHSADGHGWRGRRVRCSLRQALCGVDRPRIFST